MALEAVTVTDSDTHLTAKLSKALTELPAAYHQLHHYQLPGSRGHDETKQPRRGTLSTRSPLALEVLDLLDRRHKADVEPTRENYGLDKMAGSRRLGILPTLSQWVRLVDAELWDNQISHSAPAEQPTVDSECSWLQGHTHWITERPWITEMVDDLTRMLRDCTLITGTGTDTIKMTCLILQCGWPVKEMDGGAWFRCTGCGNAWGRLELHRKAERKKPKTLRQCAELSGVSERTLRRYLAEKPPKFKRVARDGTTDLYDIDEVMKATMNEHYKETA
jgi:hypothetical protein